VQLASFKEHATGKVTVKQEGHKLHGARQPPVLPEDFNLLGDCIYTTKAVYNHHKTLVRKFGS